MSSAGSIQLRRSSIDAILYASFGCIAAARSAMHTYPFGMTVLACRAQRPSISAPGKGNIHTHIPAGDSESNVHSHRAILDSARSYASTWDRHRVAAVDMTCSLIISSRRRCHRRSGYPTSSPWLLHGILPVDMSRRLGSPREIFSDRHRWLPRGYHNISHIISPLAIWPFTR